MAVQITFRVPQANIINLKPCTDNGADYELDMLGQRWWVTTNRGRNGTYFLATAVFSMQMKLVHKLERQLTKQDINCVVHTVEVEEVA